MTDLIVVSTGAPVSIGPCSFTVRSIIAHRPCTKRRRDDVAEDGREQSWDEYYYGTFYWHGIPTLLGCPLASDPAEADIALVGLPWTNNPTERGQYLAPRAVRHRSGALRGRWHREFGVNPFELARVRDFGDVTVLNLGQPDEGVWEVVRFYERLDAGGCLPLTIGGDHACTYPVLRAIAGPHSRRRAPLGLIHFDSHTDTYGEYLGTVHNAGNWARLGAEEGLLDPGRVVQVGLNGPYYPMSLEWARDAGYRLLPFIEIEDEGIPAAIAEIRRVVDDGPAYLTFDVDVLTLADAPGVANPAAGGLTINEAFRLLRGLRGLEIVGADIVCFVPQYDPSSVTAIHVSYLLHHLVTLMAETVARRGTGD
jgi:guanidinopropionase